MTPERRGGMDRYLLLPPVALGARDDYPPPLAGRRPGALLCHGLVAPVRAGAGGPVFGTGRGHGCVGHGTSYIQNVQEEKTGMQESNYKSTLKTSRPSERARSILRRRIHMAFLVPGDDVERGLVSIQNRTAVPCRQALAFPRRRPGSPVISSTDAAPPGPLTPGLLRQGAAPGRMSATIWDCPVLTSTAVGYRAREGQDKEPLYIRWSMQPPTKPLFHRVRRSKIAQRKTFHLQSLFVPQNALRNPPKFFPISSPCREIALA